MDSNRIAFITSTIVLSLSSLSETGVSFDDSMIIKAGPAVSITAGYRLAERLLENKNLSADSYFAVSDHFAIGMMRKFKSVEIRIPEDVAITASGNLPEDSDPEISLTISEMDIPTLCARALELLFNEIDKGMGAEAKHMVVSPKLIQRGSC